MTMTNVPGNDALIAEALDKYQQIDGYHKEPIIEILEAFGAVLLALAPQPPKAETSRVEVPYAYCCNMDPATCDCVNPNHGKAFINVDQPKAETLEEVLREVAAERRRQISVEGWTPEHDDEHCKAEIARAAATYAMAGAMQTNYLRENFLGEWVNFKFSDVRSQWPNGWDWSFFKPTTPRRDLIKSAALTVAEIERLDRVALTAAPAANGEGA